MEEDRPQHTLTVIKAVYGLEVELVQLHTAHFLRAGVVVAPDCNSDVTVCSTNTTSNHMQAARHQAGSAAKPLGRWGETGDEREVRGEHLVGQQSGFLEFLAYKGRMCVLATLRRTLMEEREEGGVVEGRRGCQFGSLLPGHVPAIVCQPGKHFQNTWRSGVGGDSSRSSQLSDTIQQSV
ncbi:hypothetical protein VZT92_019658 [Zoarces viviparus]|uniref:Uncharacterized protein n=1 Tax=Zoarces viviparus TaxID=48416 RepID=A0AAW1EMM1_ZOAVI